MCEGCIPGALVWEENASADDPSEHRACGKSGAWRSWSYLGLTHVACNRGDGGWVYLGGFGVPEIAHIVASLVDRAWQRAEKRRLAS